MKFILGKKLEMTQVFKDDGTVIPVTSVLATPNVVTQVKSVVGKDGYNAVAVGWGVAKKLGKTKAGHLKGIDQVRSIKEFKVDADDVSKLTRGDKITVEVFAEGDEIKVTGTSKGKGFQGVVKRHGFHGSPKTHGHKDQVRMPGSIGAGGVQRVFKGVRMAGHMGAEQVTVSGLKIVAIDAEKNLLYVKGAIPGARNSEVMVYGLGEMEIKREETPVVETPIEEVKEDVVVEAPVTEVPAEETKVETVVEETPVVETPAEEVKTEEAVEEKAEEVKSE